MSVDREASPVLNVVKEFVTKFGQQTLEYRARDKSANTEGEMFRKCIITVFRNNKMLPALTTIAPLNRI